MKSFPPRYFPTCCHSAVLAAMLCLPAHAQDPGFLPPTPPQWSLLEDIDQDGLTDWDEFILLLDPLDPSDGLSDADGDVLSLAWEWQLGTDSDMADTDGDGWSDSEEVLAYGTDPLDSASRPVAQSPANDDDTSAVAAPVTTAVTVEPPLPPYPSLSNGDFTDISIPTWRNMTTSKAYQGGGFEWGEGTATSWTAYAGTTIEVWKSNGETFVELDGNKTSYGVKQPISNVRAGAYVLTWKQSGRNSSKAGTDPYYVRIYHEGSTDSISKSQTYSGFDKMSWTNNAHAFQITPEQITAAAGKPIYVAFIPESLNTFGTLIDKVNLGHFDIEEVISDQIAGNEANKLPTKYYKDQPNNPMLMATRDGTDARMMIKMNVANVQATSIRVGIRVKGETTIISSSAAVTPPAKTPLAFTAQDGSKLYEIVSGYDSNRNSILESNEVMILFQKTPKTNPDGKPYDGSDTTYQFLDKIMVVTKNDYVEARKETEEYDSYLEVPCPTGSDLMGMFARGETTMPGVDQTVWGQLLDASVIPSSQGLSHPLGAKWDAKNQDQTFKIIFPFNSPIAIQVHNSTEFKLLQDRLLRAIKPHLLATATDKYKKSDPIPFEDKNISFERTAPKTDLHLALGKCGAKGTIRVTYNKSSAYNKINIRECKIDGNIIDLYDWAYGTKVVFLGTNVDITKDAAKTQAGHATLTDSSNPLAGRVFFTNVEIKTGWKLVGTVY